MAPVPASLWARLRAAGAGRLGKAAFSSSSPSSSPRPVFARQFVCRLLGLATWLPVAIWFNSTVAEVTRIEGPSMYPFLNSQFNESLERDWVLNRKLYAQEGLQRGMVVFLKYAKPFFSLFVSPWPTIHLLTSRPGALSIPRSSR